MLRHNGESGLKSELASVRRSFGEDLQKQTDGGNGCEVLSRGPRSTLTTETVRRMLSIYPVSNW